MANSELTREQVIDILQYIGVTKIVDRETKRNIQFCCPVHGENTPSMGYSLEKGLCHCFSCGFAGTIQWLVLKTLTEEFKNLREVDDWILFRYGVDLRAEDKIYGRTLRRYGIEIPTTDNVEDIEEEPKGRFELPKSYIAPFRSGKETYKYFFDRGFTKDTMREYKIGRDLIKQTVTIPVFHQDGVLTGVVGRYIDPNRPKNSRYAVYEFPKGSTLYPMHTFKPLVHNGMKIALLVEGILDGLWLHQLGHHEALAILGNQLSNDQAKILKGLDLDMIILAYDEDIGGERAVEVTKKLLGEELPIKQVVYPKGKKDPQELSLEEINTMINNCLNSKRRLKRRVE